MSRQPNVVWWKENGPRARPRFRFGPITSLLYETVQATSTCSPVKWGSMILIGPPSITVRIKIENMQKK